VVVIYSSKPCPEIGQSITKAEGFSLTWTSRKLEISK
jgi:hypothetical protein